MDSCFLSISESLNSPCLDTAEAAGTNVESLSCGAALGEPHGDLLTSSNTDAADLLNMDWTIISSLQSPLIHQICMS